MTERDKLAHEALDAARREVPGAEYLITFSRGSETFAGPPENLEGFLADARYADTEFMGVACRTKLSDSSFDLKCLTCGPVGASSRSNHLAVREAAARFWSLANPEAYN